MFCSNILVLLQKILWKLKKKSSRLKNLENTGKFQNLRKIPKILQCFLTKHKLFSEDFTEEPKYSSFKKSQKSW